MRGQPVEWTKENLERVLEAAGQTEHQALADELGISKNTIYSTRRRVELAGGIDGFLEQTGRRKMYRRSETLAEQLGRVYLIRASGSGRNGQHVQYTVTLPPLLAEAFLQQWERTVQFVPLEDGIKMIPVVTHEGELPAWASELSA